jgi:malate dehydrogenase (oxaloacetate-decarboxylating)
MLTLLSQGARVGAHDQHALRQADTLCFARDIPGTRSVCARDIVVVQQGQYYHGGIAGNLWVVLDVEGEVVPMLDDETPVKWHTVAPELAGDTFIETALTGERLLEYPLLNKGSAFSEAERRELGLLGLLPPHVATMEQQLARTYENFRRKGSDLERYIFLASLQDRNETLFYRLLQEHIREMSPIIYTPEVGEACENYSHIYRRARGLYISYPQRDDIETTLRNANHRHIRVIVVTDGERILGLGDLGLGGMGIPVGKLALYTLCAGIHPATTLPVMLDTGTNNPALLDDPLYLGWRHERVRGAEYDAFIDAFVQGVRHTFPDAVLQWEDFAKDNARRLLDRYQQNVRSFNDDIQGTGAVTLAGLLAAMDVVGSTLAEQRIVVLGAGSAATGICEQVVAAMVEEGMSQPDARATIWLVDSHGLVHNGRSDLDPSKRMYAQPYDRISGWGIATPGQFTLEDVVRAVHPTVLIGTAALPGAFSETIVREMARHTQRPIIFPLSNPTAKSEATPADLIAWTEGQAIVATGSPFADVTYGGRAFEVGQCNNMFIFPGVGLGVIASGARLVTNRMFVAAARALSACSPARRSLSQALYPPLEEVRAVSQRVAMAVAAAAVDDGLAEPLAPPDLDARIRETMWEPRYASVRYASRQ